MTKIQHALWYRNYNSQVSEVEHKKNSEIWHIDQKSTLDQKVKLDQSKVNSEENIKMSNCDSSLKLPNSTRNPPLSDV